MEAKDWGDVEASWPPTAVQPFWNFKQELSLPRPPLDAWSVSIVVVALFPLAYRSLRLDPLVPEPLLQEQLATNLTRTLTLCGDLSAIHPADELNFDISEQHKDSDTQRRDSNGHQRLT